MMCRISRSVLRASCVAFCVAAALPVCAVTYYVDGAKGDDGYDGMSPTVEGDNVGPKATIAAAVAVMAEDDTLSIAPCHYKLDAQVTSSLGKLKFIGADANPTNVLIDGQGVCRAFCFQTTSTYTFRNLMFTNCAVTAANELGSAIRIAKENNTVYGNVFSNCVFTCCRNPNGSGTVSANGATFRNCIFSQNTAKTAGVFYDTYLNAGNQYTIYFYDCLCVSNVATGAGGCFNSSVGQAGYNLHGCRFEGNSCGTSGGVRSGMINYMTNSVFVGNVAGTTGGAISDTTRHGERHMRGCTFIGNQAKNGAGGAWYNMADGMSFHGCTFEDNTATGDGGALYSGGRFRKLENCTFRRNRAGVNGVVQKCGGAVINMGGPVVGCLFEGNSATQAGGAIYGNEMGVASTYGTPGPMTISNCVFRGNWVSGTQSAEGIRFYGGAVSFGSVGTGNALGLTTSYNLGKLQDCVFIDNALTNCTHWTNYKSFRWGGAVFDSGDLLVERCAFTNNVCDGEGGALFCIATSGVWNCTFHGNRAGYDKPGTCAMDSLNGGAFASEYCPIDGTNVLVGCRFTENLVRGTGGSAVFTSQGALRLQGCEFVGNEVRTNGSLNISGNFKPYGGAVCLYGLGAFDNGSASNCNLRKQPKYAQWMEVEACVFSNNVAQGGGGAIAAHMNYVTNNAAGVVSPRGWVRNSLFVGNESRTYAGASGIRAGGGGAVSVDTQAVSLENCTFVDNAAVGTGGAAYVGGTKAGVTNCVFHGNSDSSLGATYDLYLKTPAVAAYCYAGTASPLLADGAHNIKDDANPFCTDDHCAYALKKDSGRDAGLSLNWMPGTLDLGGKPRLAADGSVDMGCYQRWFKPGLLLFVR